MKWISAVIWSVLVLSQQYHCYTEEDLAEALWSDTNNMLRRTEMREVCRFLLRNGNNDIDPASIDRVSINVYKSLYTLLAYINEPLLEEALVKRMQWRCRQQLQQEEAAEMDVDGELVHKRSENEKVVGKKVKFHSWGGKRTSDAGNDAGIPNPAYRAKFHSWGGRKRSVPVAKQDEAL